jgi:hypothetical protein
MKPQPLRPGGADLAQTAPVVRVRLTLVCYLGRVRVVVHIVNLPAAGMHLRSGFKDTTNFRREWITACVKVGFGTKTGEGWLEYEGLNPHDFRRSAVRNLTNAGIDQGKAMKITGHKTAAVFERYNIKTTADLHEASDKFVAYHADPKTRSHQGKISIAERCVEFSCSF